MTWLTDRRPDELTAHWQTEYPQVATAGEKMAQLEQNDYSPLVYFPLPRHCWMKNYYGPLRARFAGFAARHGDAAAEIITAEQAEIALYEEYSDYFSYEFYIAKRL